MECSQNLCSIKKILLFTSPFLCNVKNIAAVPRNLYSSFGFMTNNEHFHPRMQILAWSHIINIPTNFVRNIFMSSKLQT